MKKRYYSVNNWLVDISSGSILHLTTGERKRLGEYQLKLLDILVQDTGKIFTREALTNLVWENRVIGNNSLPNAIHALRAALEDDGKMQRIIKTIPRKGYLIEAEYCCVVEKEEDEVSVIEGEATAVGEIPDGAPLVPELSAAAEVTKETLIPPEQKKNPRGILMFLLTILVTAMTTAASCWSLFGGDGEHLVAREIEPGVYSNIQIYAIETTRDPAYMSTNIYDKIKTSLYTLNQQIKMQSSALEIYFRSNNSALNYSFVLANKCDKKQLAMAIYHWRTDQAQLNDLILRETRRKLNELAVCKTR